MVKFMKNIYKKNVKLLATISRCIFSLILLFIQIKIFDIEWHVNTKDVIYFHAFLEVLRIVLILHIIYKLQSTAYKLVWSIFILLFPVPGLVLYILFGNTNFPKSFQQKLDLEDEKSKPLYNYDKEIYEEIGSLDKIKYNEVTYIQNTTGLPLYRNSSIDYLETGEKYFNMLLDDISKAKKYIFINFFSIAEGQAWRRLLTELKLKTSEGVKVYILTDALANSEKYPKNFKKDLENAGIEYRLFNPLSININSYLNYRDHRKMAIIDGKVVYTGGINIGDPYINAYEKFGYWKDVGVKITGAATLTYIILFIKIWNVCSKNQLLNYKEFLNEKLEEGIKENGYIVPYCDGPDNTCEPAQNIYIKIISTAKNYVYITSPYLTVDDEVINALVTAARSGVDVRIILPYIPDKKSINMVAKSFYHVLLEAGVKIYEFKLGFIHAKTFISDDDTAIVGTINLDSRGLYFHYECANWIYKTGVELDVKEDFLKTQNDSIEIKLDIWKKRGVLKRILDKILMTIAPLL